MHTHESECSFLLNLYVNWFGFKVLPSVVKTVQPRDGLSQRSMQGIRKNVVMMTVLVKGKKIK